MTNISKFISTNFNQNIDYIQTNHPAVFAKLSAYENAVANGHYKERYELVYENGGFDIYENKTQNYLYKKEPQKFTKLLFESVDNSRQNNVFIASKELLQTISSQDMLNVDKFVFFGVGAATHIEQICNKFTPKSCFIVEDDLELFRLSLMTINYSILAQQTKLYFAVFEDENEFKHSSKLFLEQQFFYNHYIKFLQLPSFAEIKLQQFHTHITTQSHLNFSYKSILEQYTQPLSYLKKGFSFLNILKTQLPDIPTLLIAPGPSLSKHIKWLQTNQGKFLLIALSATLPILQKHNISPDIITHVDGFQRSKKHFDALESLDFITNTPLLFSARTPQSILKIFDKKNIFLFENGTDFKNNFGNFSTFCAGSASYLLCIVLGVKKLYFLGLDLAVDQKTLKTHAEDYQYNLEAKQDDNQVLSFRDSLIQTKGNFQSSVKTTPNFTLSITAINEITQGLKAPEQKVFNLNDGAYFQEVEPLKIEQLQEETTYDKQALKQNLLKLFNKHSETKLSSDEKTRIINTKQQAIQVQKQLNSIQTVTITNKTGLEQELINLFQNITKGEQETLPLILKTYCFTYYPVIFDELNTTKDENLMSIYKKLVRNLLNIIATYIKALDE